MTLANGWGIVSVLFLVAAATAPVRSLFFELRQRMLLARRIVIIGSGTVAIKLLEEIASIQPGSETVAGVIDNEPLPRPCAATAKWLGTPSQLAEIVERERPARIVV